MDRPTAEPISNDRDANFDGIGHNTDYADGKTSVRDTMAIDHTRFGSSSRAIESIYSGMLLFGFALLLSLFMAAVIFINGA